MYYGCVINAGQYAKRMGEEWMVKSESMET